MFRFLTVMVLAMFFLGGFIGLACNSKGEVGGIDKNIGELNGDTDNYSKVEYKTIEQGELPKNISALVKKLENERGYFVFTSDGFDTSGGVYVLLSAGEQKTGGYTIKTNEVKNKNGELSILVEEKAPAKNTGVAQVITYPLEVIYVDGEHDSYKVKTKEGKTLNNLAKTEIDEPNVKKEENLEPIPECDTRKGEIFIEGEITTINQGKGNNKIVVDIHKCSNTPEDVDSAISLKEDVLVRKVEEIGDGKQQESKLSVNELETGMITGLILTPEKQARAIIVHCY